MSIEGYDSSIIETALNQVVNHVTENEAGDIIVEWIVVAYVTNADEEKGGGCAVFVSNGDIARHRAIGLLHMGISQIEER